MKTAEDCLKEKLDPKIIILNNPDYTFNKIIEAMESYKDQFLPSQNDGWIPVSERLPEQYQICLQVANDMVSTGWLDRKNEWTNDHNVDPIEVTHWQPLPSPPKQ